MDVAKNLSFREKYFGNREFYRRSLTIAVPIIVQNGITNFVSLLDNIMVGQVGTAQMSGVAIVNQLMFVYNLCIFGGLSGAGIFTAQYYGRGDQEGIRHTFRYKLWVGLILTLAVLGIFAGGGSVLIGTYLNGAPADNAEVLNYGLGYLKVMMVGLPAFMIAQLYASTMRDCGETLVPMQAGVIAVFVNLAFNYLLIYGKFGFPKLGVVGAAAATVLSRYVEMAIVMYRMHRHPERNPYIRGMYRTFKIPLRLVKTYFLKGFPLLVNEALWAAGIAVLSQCYSVRGLDVVAGMNIANTINNLFNVVMISLGNSVGILVGQLLGAGRMEEAKDTDNKLIMFSILAVIPIAGVMLLFAPWFPKLYNTTADVRLLAARFIMLQALFMPQASFLNSSYFTLRCGGKTLVTFFFDSVFITCVSVPIAFVLSRFTGMHVLWIFACVNLADLIKCVIGYILVRRNIWMNNLTDVS